MLYTRKFIECSSKLLREDVLCIMNWIESSDSKLLDSDIADSFYMRHWLIEDMYKVGLIRKSNNEPWKWVWSNLYDLEHWMIEYTDEDYENNLSIL